MQEQRKQEIEKQRAAAAAAIEEAEKKRKAQTMATNREPVFGRRDRSRSPPHGVIRDRSPPRGVIRDRSPPRSDSHLHSHSKSLSSKRSNRSPSRSPSREFQHTSSTRDRSPPHSRDRQDRSYSSRDRSPPRESYGHSSRTRSPPPSRWDRQQPPSPQVFGRVQTLREGDYGSVKRTYDAPYTVCFCGRFSFIGPCEAI